MLNGFGWPHMLILVLVVVLLFGSKRLPEMARGLGKSARILKAEARGMREEDEQAKAQTEAAPQIPPAAPVQQPNPGQTQRSDQAN